VILFHVTHRRHMKGIDKNGLLPEKAAGKEKAVWLVTRTFVCWALAHTANKPGRGPINKLVVYRCELKRPQVRRYRRGLYRCFEVVRPIGIEPVSAFTDTYPNGWPR
jgi:hypothetical protein